MSRTTPPIARWGLLLTTLALGAALVATAVLNYFQAARASAVVMRARGTGLVVAARRTLRHAEVLDNDVLAEFLSETQAQGLRFIGIVDMEGTLVSSAGEALGPLQSLPAGCRCDGAEVDVEPVGKGDRMRVVAALDPRGHGPHHPGKHPPPWLDHRLVVEFDPVEAREISNNALVILVVGLVAAVVLLGAAAVSWRLSGHAEAVAVQLAEDRQLKMLGQMSAVLGHELRNPLASLKGHAQLLLEKLPPDHPGRAGAERVVHEARRMEELTGQILDFARTGALQRKLEDPVALAQAVVDAAGGGITRLSVRGQVPSWPLDRARMEQVLGNLLQNAVQASPAGAAVDFTVEAPEAELRFEVRDQGEGIEPGEEERIFEPFYTKRVKGTGLGLTVARRIVEGHGGRIFARSHPEGGALFTVSLPRAPEEG